MFKLTENCQQRLSEIVNHEKNYDEEKLFIRLSMGFGWGAPKLNLSLEEQTLTDDQLYDFEKVKILIHEKDSPFFDQTKLDYVQDTSGNGRFQLLKI